MRDVWNVTILVKWDDEWNMKILSGMKKEKWNKKWIRVEWENISSGWNEKIYGVVWEKIISEIRNDIEWNEIMHEISTIGPLT